MAEQFLHDADVGTVIEHVRRARVTQHVRAHPIGQVDPRRRGAHELPAALPREPPAPSVQEDRVTVARRVRACTGAVTQGEPSPAEVLAQGSACRPAHGHLALLVALTEHTHEPVVEIEGFEVEPDELADADAGGVEQLENGAVALREGVLTRDRAEQRRDLDLVQCLGNALGHARRLDDLARVGREQPLAHEEAVE